ncbi:MAG: PstS family phosphate ABC transporter substrate-binding protein, partial [Actinomycetes bacterium]
DQAEDISKISVDGGDGCVAPSVETVNDGSYPLSRTLYIYVNADKAQQSDALRAFVSYYLTEGASFVEEADFMPLPDADAAASSGAWKSFVAAAPASESTTTTAAG